MLLTPLPKLALTPQQCDEYEAVAQCVRDHTITKYETYLAQCTSAPAFDKRKWKLLKQKERFSIYTSREAHHATAFPRPTKSQLLCTSTIHQSAEWQPQTKLQCVGSYVGTLDDAMYGGVTPTAKAMMERSLGIQDQFVDHKTLCDITIPTEDDPFTYAGLKWSARPPYLATMVKPRDLTYVQSTGFCEINNNGNIERVGYLVYHSVDIPEVPELTEQGFRRCRFSLSVISRPTGHGTIDVFATVASDAGGDLPRELTTLFSVNALLGVHKSMDNALKKKLVWLRATRSHAWMRGSKKTFARRGSCIESTTSASLGASCPQCTRGVFKVLQSLKICHVCESRVCSRCLSSQTLVLGHTKAQLRRVDVPTCNGCIAEASQMNVRELAIHEFVKPFQTSRPRSRTRSTDSTQTAASSPTDTPSTDVYLYDGPLTRAESQDYPTSNYHHQQQQPPPPPSASIEDARLRLWTQMNQLREQVERTYHATAHTSHVVQQMFTSRSSRPLDATRPRRQTAW